MAKTTQKYNFLTPHLSDFGSEGQPCKAALVNLLSRRVSLQQRISLVQCGDTAGLECLARSLGMMMGSGQDIGQHIQVLSTTLK